MIQCTNGHFYNSGVNSSCPHCQGQASAPGGNKTVGVTPPQQNQQSWNAQGVNSNQNPNSNPIPIPNPNPNVIIPPRPHADIAGGAPKPVAANNEGKTIGLFMKKEGIDPVVGWLVCIEGKDRGSDYRIHSERNIIGRAPSNDIAITGDETISRENHAAVVYDPKKKHFRLLAGGGRGLVYVNDEAVDYSVPLKDGDTIELGESKLMFVPLCGEDFDW